VRRLGPLSLIALLIACRPSSEASSPTAVVQRFYATTISQRVTGAPTEPQLVELSPFVSDTLRALLAAARRRSDADAAREPNEKPSFAEGDLFSSLFEGPNAVEVLADSARGELRVATVKMTSTGATPPVTWVDRVLLVRRGEGYVIDDIEYGGQWDFSSKGTLRAGLVAGLAAPP
jgi:hypothetical protein